MTISQWDIILKSVIYKNLTQLKIMPRKVVPEWNTQPNQKGQKMALKYCQSHKCHTYDTKDRKRGSKGNRKNQTRRRSDFYYGGGNFCSMNCYNDWADQFMDRAIDQVSGRLHQPMTLTEENAWRQVWNPNRYDDNYQRVESEPDYIERNMITNELRPIQN